MINYGKSNPLKAFRNNNSVLSEHFSAKKQYLSPEFEITFNQETECDLF